MEAADNIVTGARECCVWKKPEEMDHRAGSKLHRPVYDLGLADSTTGSAISAGDVRNAIVREPSCSTSSFVSTSSPVSRTSSQNEASSQPSDSE